jgi:glycerophosphoryl diester phosphodiesterase
MLRIVAAAVAASCLAYCAPGMEAPAMWGTLDGKPPLVIAHRGASGHLPEHTLEAYALAIDQGADVVEPDLVFTKDGVLVARHDRYLSTTTDVADKPEFAARMRANDDRDDAENRNRIDWWVEDFRLAELKTLRARQPFPGRSKEFDGLYEIPTLDEMLALVARKAKEAGRPVGVYPETKHPAFFASIGHDFEKPLLEALQDFDAGPVFIQSFEPEILKRLRGKTDAKLVQLVYEVSPGAGPNIPLAEIAKYADGVGADKQLALDAKGVRSSIIRDSHSRSLFMHLWTVRDDLANEGVKYALAAGNIGQIALAENLERVDDQASKDPVALELFSFYGEQTDGVFTDFPGTAVKWRDEFRKRSMWE